MNHGDFFPTVPKARRPKIKTPTQCCLVRACWLLTRRKEGKRANGAPFKPFGNSYFHLGELYSGDSQFTKAPLFDRIKLAMRL